MVRIFGCLFAFAMVASPALAQVNLNLSVPDSDTSEIAIAANHFASLVDEKTQGAVKVQVFPNGTLYGGDPSAAVRQLAGGSLDALLLSTSLYANFNPKFTAISIPYLFDDTEQLRGYLDGELGQGLIAELDDIGIKGLDIWPRPFRQITNSKHPINTPADLAGLKLRVPNNPLWMEFFAKLGAVPTPMAFAEVYNALQLHVVDGQENPITIPLTSHFYEVQGFATISNHMADGWVLAFNPSKFGGLTEEQRAAVESAALETEEWKVANDASSAETTIAELTAKGMAVNELTADQQHAFVAVASDLFPKFSELVKDQGFFDATLAAVGKN